MTDRTAIEAEIRTLIATETHPIRLSNKLFSPPDGLFCVIGMPLTSEERRAVASGELFKAAQHRINELERAWLGESDPTSQPAAPTQPAPASTESIGV